MRRQTPYTIHHIPFVDSGRYPAGQVVRGGHHILKPGDRFASPYGRRELRVVNLYAFMYCLRGQGRYVTAEGVDVNVGPGDLAIIFPDVAYRCSPDVDVVVEPWHCVFAVFCGPIFDQWRRMGFLRPENPVHRLEPVSQWRSRCESVGKSLSPSLGPEQMLPRVCMVQWILAEAISQATRPPTSESDRRWLSQACRLLSMEGAVVPAGPRQAAQQMGVSYKTFLRRFERFAGVHPGRFRAQSIIEQASILLEKTDLPMAQVARRCGFWDEFHFSRRFKQLTGLSPSQYRQRHTRLH